VVGADAAGTARVDELVATGVRCAVRSAEASTGTVIVLSSDGERHMLADRGANLLIGRSDVDDAWTPDVTHVHVSGYTLLDPQSRPAGRHALACATDRGATTSVDAASAAPLRHAPDFLAWVRGVDLLLANADEARVLAGGTTAELTRVAANVVVKYGADGAVWATTSGVVRVAAEPAEVRDPTGAGDAFAAGLIAAWLSGSTPEAALAAGAALGARAVAALGGRP
jgi:sugar/nucleoside kinase (ribokinase family)